MAILKEYQEKNLDNRQELLGEKDFVIIINNIVRDNKYEKLENID
jgi:hypothetical protein